MLEIEVPQTKPATEWVNGRALQKMNPRERHGRAQGAFLVALLEWARTYGCGRVSAEWDFRLAPPGEPRRPLVPDVAYLSYERVGYDDDEGASIPVVAPNAVVEVLSPGDAQRDVDENVRVYLASGAEVVFIVDPVQKTVEACDARGRKQFGSDEVLTHASLAGFALPVARIFEKIAPRE
ncbi:MAG TPA: Uma2 family endonuclease [Candidatus Eremiobacteraceae bacterium]|nr:Uma2 family endonuclease [Candidatus Eremiobacteraceae bacterium]